MTKLRTLAYARSGDKGSHANIGVIAFDLHNYKKLEKSLTIEVVENYFKKLKPKEVIRYSIPNLLAFNFILKGVLQGGGSYSLHSDSQGKTLGQSILELEIN